MYSLLMIATLVFSQSVNASDCGVEQGICETTCKVRFITNDAEKAGCLSRCVAERTLCSAKVGTEKAKDLSEDIWQESKSFLEGFTADSAKELGTKAWQNTQSFMDGLINKDSDSTKD